jgi:AAA domain
MISQAQKSSTWPSVSATERLLAAWLTLEVLSPHPLPKKEELATQNRKVVHLDECPDPWHNEIYRKLDGEEELYWMIYLGELDLTRAYKNILETFKDELIDEREKVEGWTTLAVVLLDEHGHPIPGSTFLSSFAWGYGRILAGQPKELGGFIEDEGRIKAEMDRKLILQDIRGEIIPLGPKDLAMVTDELIKTLNLPADEVSRSSIAVRIPQRKGQKTPEPELLNSFFLGDLLRVQQMFREGNVGRALSTYLGVEAIRERQDVVQDRNLLEDTLAPGRMPLTRWPGRGRHPLYLMQQAAVNHIVRELADCGLVAVNGPPGTGKTTLLRDIVAKVVLDRAIVMSQFDDPATAFRPLERDSYLYRLDERLLGHEIVVASSNNKAVENISREIPSSAAIADDFNPPLCYFRSISDALAASGQRLVDGKTWGLAAAVLGNSDNRWAFRKTFWNSIKRGIRPYLWHAQGREVFYVKGEEDNAKDDVVHHVDDDGEELCIPRSVLIDKPPYGRNEALACWDTARQDFLVKLERVRELQKKAQDAHTAVRQEAEESQRAADAVQALAIARGKLILAEERETIVRRLHERALDNERKAVEDRSIVDRIRPGFVTRLIRPRINREWRHRLTVAVDAVAKAREEEKRNRVEVERAQSELDVAKAEVLRAETERIEAEQALTEIRQAIDEGKRLIKENFVDQIFWQRDAATVQKSSPWLFTELQLARDDLFAASFELHRAFIGAAAEYLHSNLRKWFDVMSRKPLTHEQEPVRQSLWASLFMVVPVVSTTFASTSSLFAGLEKEQISWLLIDEAGQAAPQQAVGAIWRARRAVVIGDPLQIEPVVLIPEKLVNAIFKEFDISPDKWAAPTVSAQILADRASWFGTTIRSTLGDIWVGSPLRVHRRCEDPMFSISNNVAYGRLMVYGTESGSSQIGEILKDSRWIVIEGESKGKWSSKEGEMVLRMLRQLLKAEIRDPDIFFITPFRIVSTQLREMIMSDERIRECFLQDLEKWTERRVGTIHTFQGKEADTVVLVLGAPGENSAGARRWASKSPNLLNVAVTRAKRRLYVVGSLEAWQNKDYFQYLASTLRKVNGKD